MSENASVSAVATTARYHPANSTKVPVDELILGRPLRFPIFDEDGLLLLAEGTAVSSEFKKRLKSRSIFEVAIHNEDLKNLTLQVTHTLKPRFSFDNETTRRLDAFIESGSLFVANSGPALREQMVLRGRKGYDAQERERLVQRHAEVSSLLDKMIQEALHGELLDSSRLFTATADYLTAMMSDSDNLLTIANEVGSDPRLANHCLQMSLLGMAMGIEMGMDERNVRTIGLCGLLHDWGMIMVPKELRELDRVLNAEEFAEIKKHPIYVLDLLKKIAGIPSIVPLVCYQVHEAPNGSGYPRERQKNTIHIFARVLGVADAFIALTSPRPYRKPLMPYAAMECVLHMAKLRNLDADAVRALLQVLSLFPVGSFVTLSDGSIGQVLRRNGHNYANPIIQRVQDSKGNAIPEGSPDSVVALGDGDLHVVQALPTPGKKEVSLSPDIIAVKRS